MRSAYPQGFALPTVLIVFVVMFTVLTVAVSAVTGTSRTMNDQFYNQLAREAAESGIKHAQKCLEQNNYVAQWGAGTSRLRPGTSCAGSASQCTLDSCYLSINGLVRTTYEIMAPEGTAGSASQTVNVRAVVEVTRSTTGATVQTYEYTRKGRTGGMLGLTSVVHGYYFETGVPRAYFIATTNDGSLRSVGANHYGQLSTGNTNSSHTVEMNYQGLPASSRPEKVYTQFKSVDSNTMVQLQDGRLYVSGENMNGQLGLGHTSNVLSAQQYPLPNSPSGQAQRVIFASNGRTRTYVIGATADPSNSAWTGNVYAQGACGGTLGTGFTCTGNRTTPLRVALPTSVSGDPNTKPIKVVADGGVGMVLMEGGAVYGFGGLPCGIGLRNHAGQTTGWTPVRLGTYTTYFGTPGLTAVDIDTDGTAVYVRMADGRLFSAGCNDHGQVGSMRTRLETYVPTGGGVRQCMDIRGGGWGQGTRVQIWECQNTIIGDTAQSWALTEDGRIYNKARNMCLDISGGNITNGSPIQIWPCNNVGGGVAQKFLFGADNRIRVAANPAYCIDMENGGPTAVQGSGLYLWSCNQGSWQQWNTRHQDIFEEVYVPDSDMLLPANNGRVLRMSSDWGWVSMLVDLNGSGTPNDVYSYGVNNLGQQGLGTGSESMFQPAAKRFTLPGGVTARDFNLTGHVPGLALSNMLVVGSDGKVYGAGADQYCQLGRGVKRTTINPSPLPIRQDGSNDLTGIKSVTIGGGTSILVTEDNRLLGVGNNNHGQLGDGTTVDRCYPVSNFFVNRMRIISY